MTVLAVASFALLLVPQAAPPQTHEPAQKIALAPPVRLECDSGPIDSGAYIAHSGPLFADLDGDRKPELLVGNFSGHFQYYANVGEANAPRFVAKGLLQAAGQDIKIHNW